MTSTPDDLHFAGATRHPVKVTVSSAKTKQTSTPLKVSTPTPVVLTDVIQTQTTPAWTKLPLYVDPYNDATAYYNKNPLVDGASLIKRQGETPVAKWFGDWDTDVQTNVSAYTAAAAKVNHVPVVVLYNIPNRDCGLYSSGGAQGSDVYLSWMQKAAAGIGSKTAVVILEPDALAGVDCLSPADQQSRYSMIAQAVGILKKNTNTAVYIDAGNPEWQSSKTMAARLKSSGDAQADGFSLNVSNFVTTAKNQSYGKEISKLIGNKHFVIDVSRNGNGLVKPEDWCNAPNGALGVVPTTKTSEPLNDALLWIKIPWESDGSCNGAPAAGTAYWPFAVQLARNAGWK